MLLMQGLVIVDCYYLMVMGAKHACLQQGELEDEEEEALAETYNVSCMFELVLYSFR